jgi:hypothetical protein
LAAGSARRRPRARKYAFHFFFRRMIPVGLFEPGSRWPYLSVNVRGVDALRAGADPGLDIICDGILGERAFIYPAEDERTAT